MRGLEVAIVGAGIGGLTTALALRRLGHEARLVEQASELRAVGAGISLWPNGIKVLNLLGLGAGIEAIGGTMSRMSYADRDGKVLVDFSLEELYARVGERARPVERAALQQLLLDEVGAGSVSLGLRAVGVEQHPDGVVLLTDSGEAIEADLVVAADGTHSLLRDEVCGRHVGRSYLGYVNWNGLAPETSEVAPIGTWLTFVGDGRRASVMPVGNGRCYAFFDVPMPLGASTALPALEEVVAEQFAGWSPAVGMLASLVDQAGAARIAIHDTPPLASWRRGRVVLLGDAAHTMAPDLGQGGCQAMEDAYVLAHHLSATSRGVEDALDRYQAERIPHTAQMQRRARRRADTTHGADPAATAAWYAELATGEHDAILDGLAQSVESGPCR